MVEPTTPSVDYKLHCLEKENERLIDSVKQARQNALALVAAVLFITSGVLNISKPLVSNLNTVRYDGCMQQFLMGEAGKPERAAAVARLTTLWDVGAGATVLGTAVTIAFAIILFMKSGNYAPLLDSETTESVSYDEYLALLTKQSQALRKFNMSYRRPFIWATASSLFAVCACGVLTVLWLCFGA